MSDFNRTRLLSNITYLTKEKNIKIGDLEAYANVSAGYFSRLNKSESTALPSIEVLYAIAKRLGVTIDSLVKVGYDSLTASERFVVDFLNKVLSDTDDATVEWSKETRKSIQNYSWTQDEEIVNPFFRTVEEYGEIDFSGYPSIQNKEYFNSLYHEDEKTMLTDGIAYHADLGGEDFWLFDVTIEYAEDITSKELELYLLQNRKVYPVCHTNDQCPSINELLFSLYQAAIISSKRPKVNSFVKSAIDQYMGNLPF